jgi:predicted nucleic acid-binding protein
VTGITLDTGALIALERRKSRIVALYVAALLRNVIVTVPAAVVVEWWRGKTATRERILRGVRVEHTDDELIRSAGEALAAVAGARPVDAMVMASAARRGDLVYTSDFEDLDRLRAFFPAARVLAI